MGINVVTKGKAGEREVVKLLQPMVDEVYKALDLEPLQVLRNQMQSAVGGFDLEGLPWLAVEVKRRETLDLNSWWNQVLKAAAGESREPVVIFRQNRCKWRVLMWTYVWTGGQNFHKVRAEVSYEDFCVWFKARCKFHALQTNEATVI